MSTPAPEPKFRLVGREAHPDDTLVHVGPVTIGSQRIAVIAGPCAVESREQIMVIAEVVKRSGAKILRGGALSPGVPPTRFRVSDWKGCSFYVKLLTVSGFSQSPRSSMWAT